MALISETTRPIKLSPVYTGGATLFHCPVILGMTDLHTMLFKELLIQAIKKDTLGTPFAACYGIGLIFRRIFCNGSRSYPHSRHDFRNAAI